ncbi:GNAT family N-acetyltransferase [Paenibacillus hexagrammi]|uniref:GNAT family N-acetyltransferase n=1 Tax=Paenibacillus hexagrammi TaxID=2908839 RepID=A0ABY3SLH7_9BACL|nr:GNAT family N-acetyltransferase [Paenibacillus sp. YPD9-1]UJF34041.1 GNAT family N-acetyltransferase [Paenibacillus sp. YPD9-1]
MRQPILDKGIHIDSDPARVDMPLVYRYLHEQMYWAKSLTLEQFERAVQHSAVVFGLYDEVNGGRQVGFARVISDCATFAYLTDVFILEEYREKGLSRKLMEAVLAHPKLQGLRRFLLVTEDAGGLYAKFGFQPLQDGSHWMQIFQE